jgi:uncharacterized RDD family membrane protein YckC
MPDVAAWFYLDRSGQQRGPVEAGGIAALLREGELTDSSLLWREGMAKWTALSALRSELGLPAAPVRSPEAPNAYAPPQANLREAGDEPIDGEVVPAGFLRRWAALFIDQLVVGMVYYAVFFTLLIGFGAAGAGLGGEGLERAMLGVTLVAYPIYFLIAGAYYAGFESSASQATPGKLLLSIKVTNSQGGRLSLGHALGRWAAAALSYLTLFIGFLMAAFTEQKKALHDYVSATQVVDRWAYTAFPEKQSRNLHGCVIALLIFMGAMILIAVLGIVAAIAIPAYQDYRERAGSRPALEPEAALYLQSPKRESLEPSRRLT